MSGDRFAIGANWPIEADSAFHKPRLRLSQRVPVAETLGFVYRFKDYEGYYEEMRICLEVMIDEVQRFFARDLYDLTTLKLRLTEGRYRITLKGRQLIARRLRATYNDGVGYHIHTNALERLEIKPVVDLEQRILRSGRVGMTVADLSRRIGGRVGVKVQATTHDRPHHPKP